MIANLQRDILYAEPRFELKIELGIHDEGRTL